VEAYSSRPTLDISISCKAEAMSIMNSFINIFEELVCEAANRVRYNKPTIASWVIQTSICLIPPLAVYEGTNAITEFTILDCIVCIPL
jgi:hypothetical protein